MVPTFDDLALEILEAKSSTSSFSLLAIMLLRPLGLKPEFTDYWTFLFRATSLDPKPNFSTHLVM